MEPIAASSFVNKSGKYHYRIARLIESVDKDFCKNWRLPVKTIEDVRDMARANVIKPSHLFAYRGTGSTWAPSQFMLFVFEEKLVSKKQRVSEKELAFLGEGI